jgi:acetyl esterase/lipase
MSGGSIGMKTSHLASAMLAGMVFSVSIVCAAPPDAGKPAEVGKKYEVRELRDVAYVEGKGADPVRHKLDLFLPKGKKDYPTIVFIHGGCWSFGDKSCAGLYSAVGRFLASRGVGAVLPNYRLSPWVKHPEHIKDVARAFAWTHQHIGEYSGDPDKLFVGGHSAGGHLAALLATDEQYLKAEGLSLKDVRGVVAVSGVYRIPDKVEFLWTAGDGGLGAKVEFKTNPFDLVFGKDPKGRETASPVCHVCPGLPPFLVLCAAQDLPMLPEMADEFAKALKARKCDVKLLKVEGRNHNNIAFRATEPDDPVARAMLDFIAEHGGK